MPRGEEIKSWLSTQKIADVSVVRDLPICRIFYDDDDEWNNIINWPTTIKFIF